MAPVCNGGGGTATCTEAVGRADVTGEAIVETPVLAPWSVELPAQATSIVALITRQPAAKLLLMIEPPAR
ncbi:hypothetical protein GCM10023319_71980 [Nocardia iowensis]